MILSLQATLREAIQKHGFKRLLLAVSGGLDSVCLAYYFVTNKEALGIEWLGIAHVHHGLREGTADRDAEFVHNFATQKSIPFFLKKLDGELLKSSNGSLEENARDARYAALFQFASENLADAIVTAHHANDQAETMYLRLRRGTTLEGLHGIQQSRCLDDRTLTSPTVDKRRKEFSRQWLVSSKQELKSQDAPNSHKQDADASSNLSSILYRPFLSIPREELHEYAIANSLSWCEDESNSDTKFARNRIRHLLLPNLELQEPGATAQLCHIASLADRAYAKILAAAEALFSPALATPATSEPASSHTANTPAGLPEKHIALNKKVLRKILVKHTNADLSEMFRLWLSAKGFRFPIDFFKAPKESASTRIPLRAAYRKRSIAKFGHTVWICEFENAEAATKFVSCEWN